MINKLITATTKTETHLLFDVEVSIPLSEVSKELANDVADMFDQPYLIPVDRFIEFSKSDEGKEVFKIITLPKNNKP